jgi:predicted O-methyltransferase YrrM
MSLRQFMGRVLGFEAEAFAQENRIALMGTEATVYAAKIGERDAHVREAQSIVREREAIIREREATVREREAVIECLKATGGSVANVVSNMERPQWVGPVGNDSDDFRSVIEGLLPQLAGWCSLRKALWLAELVSSSNAIRICEIGVYGGRSLLPMAIAARRRQDAVAYAVEPWSNSVAVACATNKENDQWWRRVDLKAIKDRFLSAVMAYNLTGIVKTIELSSNEARVAFLVDPSNRFDILHIDGSHAEAQALADVVDWLPLVAPGGIIVLDDIDWDTVKMARDHLRAACIVVEEVRESEDTSYGAYRVPVSAKDAGMQER